MKKLNSEEKDVLESFESGAFRRVAHHQNELKRHKEFAAAAFQKESRINIRISSKDLRMLQKRALSEGLPYQTLISSLLHKYVEGRLVEQG